MCKNLKREQINVAFKKFDQTGNDKLNIRARIKIKLAESCILLVEHKYPPTMLILG